MIDGKTLIPREQQQYRGGDRDLFEMTNFDLKQYDRDWLRAVRASVSAAMQAQFAAANAILDKAGDRALTRNQQTGFDAAKADIDTLAELRNRVDNAIAESMDGAPTAEDLRTASDAIRARWAQTYGTQTDLSDAAQANAAAPLDLTDLTSRTANMTASTVPTHRGALLPPEQRVADFVVGRGLARGDQNERIDMGKVLKGLAIGDWRDAEPERRAMAEGTGASGGYLVPTVVSSEIIDLARNQSRVFQAGARTIVMESEIEVVPRQITDPTVTWRLENSLITSGSPTFDMVTFTARSLATVVQVSRELLQDSKPDLHQLVMTAIAKAMGLEIDRVSLYGTGVAPQPQGLKGATNVPITPLGTNGAIPTWDNISLAAQTVKSNNFDPSAVIYNPRSDGELARSKDLQNRYLMPPPDIADLPRLVTNQVPVNLTQGTASTASDLFVGDFSQLWIGVRAELGIQILQERYADYGQIGFLAWWRGDVQVAHPLAFDILTGSL